MNTKTTTNVLRKADSASNLRMKPLRGSFLKKEEPTVHAWREPYKSATTLTEELKLKPPSRQPNSPAAKPLVQERKSEPPQKPQARQAARPQKAAKVPQQQKQQPVPQKKQ